jgi:hypothetical protein
MSSIFVVQTITEETDETRTIESEAEALKQAVIAKFYELNPTTQPNTAQERIVLTAGVVID